MRRTDAHISQAAGSRSIERFDECLRICFACVVGDEYLKLSGRQRLLGKRPQAAVQQIATPIRRHNHGNQRRH
jgi:hypothetical protein